MSHITVALLHLPHTHTHPQFPIKTADKLMKIKLVHTLFLTGSGGDGISAAVVNVLVLLVNLFTFQIPSEHVFCS